VPDVGGVAEGAVLVAPVAHLDQRLHDNGDASAIVRRRTEVRKLLLDPRTLWPA